MFGRNGVQRKNWQSMELNARFTLLVGLLLFGLLAVNPAWADGGTLKKIKETGTITLGHRESSMPFSYYGDGQQVLGYSHTMMLKVVEAVKTELSMPNLQIRLMPVTPANRITLVQNGTIDLECGSTTNNAERRKQVAFSNSLFIIGTRLLTRVGSPIQDFPDLAGKTVVTTAGTTSERLLRRMNDSERMRMNLISAKDHGEAFLTLETGRAVAFMMDDVLLFGERAKAKNPQDWAIVGTPLSLEAYGCMLRKDDPAFQTLVNTTLARIMTSGEAEQIYGQWFTSPIPPKNLNLDFPLSEPMRALFRAPNDLSFDDDSPAAPAVQGKTGYHWNWSVLLSRAPSGGTFLDWLLEGLQWTVLLSLTAWIFALFLGILLGVLRTLTDRPALTFVAIAYVEIFRNIPLLVQLFIWYFVLPELLPTAWGDAIKHWHPMAQQFFAAWLCLSLFTAARITEQVRAGIQSLPPGRKNAGLALGMSLPQVYRLVLLPVALRITLPPLTSEFLSIFKNSAVATTIGLIELSRQAQQLVDYTAQPYEAFIAVTVLYLLINTVVMFGMRALEAHLRVPGFMTGGGKG
ncbi:MAG: glutamate/aspartate ABC transporter substrate-binding protein [Magnetococcus sp. YQC-3]